MWRSWSLDTPAVDDLGVVRIVQVDDVQSAILPRHVGVWAIHVLLDLDVGHSRAERDMRHDLDVIAPPLLGVFLCHGGSRR